MSQAAQLPAQQPQLHTKMKESSSFNDETSKSSSCLLEILLIY
jgi:hypothetical protein